MATSVFSAMAGCSTVSSHPLLCMTFQQHWHSHTRPDHHLNVKLNIPHKVLQISVVNDRGSGSHNCSLFQAFQLL